MGTILGVHLKNRKEQGFYMILQFLTPIPVIQLDPPRVELESLAQNLGWCHVGKTRTNHP